MKEKMGMYHSSVSCERISKSLHNCFGLNSSASRSYETEIDSQKKDSTTQGDDVQPTDVAVAQPKRKISRKSLRSSKEICCCGGEKDDFQYNICSQSTDSQVSPRISSSSCPTSSVTQSQRHCNGSRDRKSSGDTPLDCKLSDVMNQQSKRLTMDKETVAKQTIVHVNGNEVSIKTVSNSSNKNLQTRSELTRSSELRSSENIPTNRLSPDQDKRNKQVTSTETTTSAENKNSKKPVIDVNYFRNLVTSETERLNESIETWNKVLLGGNSRCPAEVCDEIRTVIGQTRLVISERFTQFTKLIDRADGHNNSSADHRPVLISDLQGFWDMIYFQVQDVDSKFEMLNKMKDNSWKKNSPSPSEVRKASVKAVKKPKSAQKKQPAKKKPQSSEEDRKRREAARKRLAEARKALAHRNQVEQDVGSADKSSEVVCNSANFVTNTSHKEDETTRSSDAKTSHKPPDSIVDAITCAVAINQVNADSTSLSSLSSTSMVH